MAARKPSSNWISQFDDEAVYEQVHTWFVTDSLRAVLRAGDSDTERIAMDWLAKAGKRYRPFLAACMFIAFRQDASAPLPDSIRNVALAVECIHKASLIYDDIQDEDAVRYGQPTVHRVHGVPVALTASLLLLGLGYRLLAECDLPAQQRAEMLVLAAEGHCSLCLGQGEELLWMRSPTPLSPKQVLDVFRHKTATSFEVVFRLPAICAGAAEDVHEALRAYSAHVGTAYQVQDDLEDFHGRGDVDDVQARRLSIVLAVAYERAEGAAKQAIREAWCGDGRAGPEELRRLIAELGAEQGARDILARCKRTALDALRPLDNMGLKILLCRVTDKILPGA
jgi:geranylgeranyl pyrophosphate synthase